MESFGSGKRQPKTGEHQPTGARPPKIEVHSGFDALPRFRNPVVTVGSFDGVHRGHRALIERLVAEARAVEGESIVVTFEPHPRIVLGRGEGLRLLSPLDRKVELLAELGVDHVVVIPFDRAFSTLTGAQFVDRHLVGLLGARTLVAGYNHRFGHDRADCDTLADRAGLSIVRVGECNVGGEHVSSTVIRRMLDAGKTDEAERLLGHRL